MKVWSISENDTDKEKRKCLEGNLSQYECTQLKCHDGTVTGTTTVANRVGFSALVLSQSVDGFGENLAGTYMCAVVLILLLVIVVLLVIMFIVAL